MRVHVTVINNATGVAHISQADVAQIVHTMGWHEIGLFRYQADTDSDLQLSSRIDGVVSSVGMEDIVVFQYPSWNGNRYDNRLVDRLKIYSSKLIIFVHDIPTLLLGNGKVNQESLSREIDILNKADLLILASARLYDFLLKNGLHHIPVIYQKIWEVPNNMVIKRHAPLKRFLFTGGEDISSYTGKSPIYQFSRENRSGDNERVKWCGFLDTYSLLMELSKGGFGLVWADNELFERYDCMNQSYKLAGYLAAGLPVFVRKGCIHEEYVLKNGIGYAISSLEEADGILEGLSEREFLKIYENVKRVQSLITSGFYTRKTLNDAVIRVLDLSDGL